MEPKWSYLLIYLVGLSLWHIGVIQTPLHDSNAKLILPNPWILFTFTNHPGPHAGKWVCSCLIYWCLETKKANITGNRWRVNVNGKYLWSIDVIPKCRISFWFFHSLLSEAKLVIFNTVWYKSHYNNIRKIIDAVNITEW